ncbi:calcium, potassium:sodium antiporter [Aureococcus anophagefferens]|nr:calcium, potassium:sodium antiporter [Aureococcus anophagefferens]
MSGMLEEERFDGMLLQFAQQCQGIDPLLDTVFSFLRRKTDFFTGATDDKAKQTVLKMLEKHQLLADKTNVEKRKRRDAEEAAAAERKAREGATRRRPPRRARRPRRRRRRRPGRRRGRRRRRGPRRRRRRAAATPATTTTTEPPPGNGGVMGWGVWTQQLADLELKVPMPSTTKSRDLVVKFTKGHITIGVKGQPPILDGDLHKKVIVDDCFWTLEDAPGADGGKEVVVALQKEDKQSWWKCVVVGDPEINTQKVQPENSKLSDLDGETRMTVEKMMIGRAPAPRRFRRGGAPAARRLGAAADALEDPGARRLANATADDDDDDETGGLIIGGARIPPKPLLTKKQNLYYGWFFYVLGILWMFLGLAFVCDVYLEASLEGICTGLKLSNDVAGATFMAAGGSAPELCTSFIGVFVERSDIGFGTIVGSAVFNVLFVIAACAHVAPNLTLTWWPLARDCACYCACIYGMVIVLVDGRVTWYEGFGLLVGYGCYVTVMSQNEFLEIFVGSQLAKDVRQRPAWCLALQSMVESTPFIAIVYIAIVANVVSMALEAVVLNYVFAGFFVTEMVIKIAAYGFFWGLKIVAGVKLKTINKNGVPVKVKSPPAANCAVAPEPAGAAPPDPAASEAPARRYARGGAGGRGAGDARANGADAAPATAGAPSTPNGDAEEPPANGGGEEKEDGGSGGGGSGGGDSGGDDDDDDEGGAPGSWGEVFTCPTGDGPIAMAYWFVMLPMSIIFYGTIPDCGTEKYEKWYWVTFSLCISYVAVLSYPMVWWATELGDVLGIPEPVMGLTLLAAGTSVPDMLSSVAVAKRGYGDMAVSSSIGSNIFDLNFGLALPWFLFAVTEGPVKINSDGLTVSILTLFMMVGLVITTIHFSGWKLTAQLGNIMFGLYACYMCFAMLELGAV